jgi:hypothetical protein
VLESPAKEATRAALRIWSELEEALGYQSF